MVMVPGLDKFIKFFEGYDEHYVLIGGTACYLWLADRDLSFRSTRDLDVVVIVEGKTEVFYKRLWEFIKLGKYASYFQNEGKPKLYRFEEPETDGFPIMIELLTKKIIKVPDTSHLTPIPITGEISSLSAILLDEDYYNLVLNHQISLKGASTISADSIIPLKAKAWLDLTTRREEGDDAVQGDDIRKHRSDVFRLLITLAPAHRVLLPRRIRDDMNAFLEGILSREEEWGAIESGVRASSGVVMPSIPVSIDLIRQIFGIQ